MNKGIFEIDDKNVIIKRYKIRHAGRKGSSIETTIPKEVFEREVRRLGLNLDDAVDKLEAVWRYNSFQGLHLTLEPKEDDEE